MSNERPDFADDLSGIQQDVTADVGRILEMAKTARSTTTAPPARRITETATIPSAPVETRPRHPAKPRSTLAPAEKTIRENVSLRLPLETNALLAEAACQQHLKRLRRELPEEAPVTRQDIADEALRDWFRKHGYGR